MLSRKQSILAGFTVAVVVAIIVGAVVGTRNQQASVNGGSTASASLAKCTGEPCTADPRACRSKFGFCGIGDPWCNSESTWRPDGCTATIPVAGVNCTGQPCTDMYLCRSEWGYCGSGVAYCNAKSIWNPQGCGATTPSPSTGSLPVTPSPTTCSGQACPSPGQCRSEWGYCGTSPAYCNDKSTYSPSCPGAATSMPTTQTTVAPTLAPTTPTSAAPSTAPPSTAHPTTGPPTSASPTISVPPSSSAPTSPTTISPTVAPTSKAPTKAPTKNPTNAPITNSPTLTPTLSTRAPTSPTAPDATGSLVSLIHTRRDQISQVLLQSQTPSNTMVPSNVYKADDLEKGIRTAINGIAGMNFIADGVRGKLNVAAFLAQSMKETIKYDVCDENNWDLVGGVYPASNACGQLGQQYSLYKCSDAERFMECPIDPLMEKKAATNAKWYGAPGPLFCAPKTKVPLSPGWNYNAECNQPWANPPKLCTEYDGQKAGAFDFSKPYPNNAGRTDVEGCCWWGRGVIQLTGPCNVGKLNYFLGKAAFDRGLTDAPFPDVDFCKDPDAICASPKYPELKWVSGLFYWMRDVQSGDFGSWNYQNELTKLAADPNNANLRLQFINAVSGIVNRGSPFAGNVDGGAERANNFEMAWAVFGPTILAVSEGGNGVVQLPDPISTGDSSGSNGTTSASVDGGAVAGGVIGGLACAGLVAVGAVMTARRRRELPTAADAKRASAKSDKPKTSLDLRNAAVVKEKRLTASNPMFAKGATDV